MKNDELIEVAKLGKVVGLKGYIRLHSLSDFDEQFKKNSTYITDNFGTLTIDNYDRQKQIVLFCGVSNRDEASKYVNVTLKTTKELTREQFDLKEGEFFWFDIIGCQIIEDNNKIGHVENIDRIGTQDFLHVRSDNSYIQLGYKTNFLIPYIDRYIKNVDIKNKKIITVDAKYFLEK